MKDDMIRQTIPGTELTVSTICLGAAPIGSVINEADSFRMLDTFVELGGNFVDTALNYADWSSPVKAISEKTLGKWLKSRPDRDGIVVATKGACPRKEQFFRLSRGEIVSDLQESLSHLQTDCLGLYWLHRDDPSRPVEDIVDTLNDQVRAGHIRHFGCSNWTLERIEAADRYAQANGLQTFCANQMMWSLSQTAKERLADETIVLMDEPTMANHLETRRAAVPFSSQAGGFFSGKYSRDQPAPERKRDFVNMYWHEENFNRLDRVREIAERTGQTPAAIALAYLASHPFPVFPIIGARSLEQLAESCEAGDVRLDADTVRYLELGE